MGDEPQWGTAVLIVRMTCGKCKKSEDLESTTFAGGIERLCNRGWRVSHNYGFIHKTCEKQLPIAIKFLDSEPDN